MTIRRWTPLLAVLPILGLSACLPSPPPTGGSATPWESVALGDGSARVVFGLQEASGTTVHESVSGTITGTVVGTGMTFGASGPGSRRAIHSAGTGYIQVPNASSMQLAGTQMTYEMIAKSDLSTPTNWMTAQDFQTPSNDLDLHGYAMYANGGGGPNTISIELFTNNQGGNNPIRQAFPLTWDTNWHDWTWVLNVANGESWIRLYRDGVLIGGPRPLGMTYTLSANVHPMILFGAWNAAATTLQDWHGSIAGYALYATALTQTQITARYNAAFGN